MSLQYISVFVTVVRSRSEDFGPPKTLCSILVRLGTRISISPQKIGKLKIYFISTKKDKFR